MRYMCELDLFGFGRSQLYVLSDGDIWMVQGEQHWYRLGFLCRLPTDTKAGELCIWCRCSNRDQFICLGCIQCVNRIDRKCKLLRQWCGLQFVQ